MNFSFIGVGNMAEAIIKGMTASKKYDGTQIYGFNRSIEKTERLSKSCQIHSCKSLEEAVEAADVLILSVKPNVLPVILPEVNMLIEKKRVLVLSLAVGKTLSFLEQELGKNIHIARVMPNINAKVNASTTAFSVNKNVSDTEKGIIQAIFSTIGSIIELEEGFFPIFAALAGSSPAFSYLYIESLARAAVKAGLPKPLALRLAAESVLGSAKMILDSENHPWSLIDQVCSPGGTTIEGIAQLQNSSFEATITNAFDAILKKDKIISGNV